MLSGRPANARKVSPLLFEDIVQPVECDLMLKTLVVDSALSLAALLRGYDVLRLETGLGLFSMSRNGSDLSGSDL